MARSPPLVFSATGSMGPTTQVFWKVGSPHQQEAAAIIQHNNGMDPLLPEFLCGVISNHMPKRPQIHLLSPPSQSLKPPNQRDHE